MEDVSIKEIILGTLIIIVTGIIGGLLQI